MPRSDHSRRWLVLVLALAAALRLVPVWFGLPYEYARPDEEVAIGHAVNALGGELNPQFFHWPSFTFYFFASLFAFNRTGTYVGDLLIARAAIAVVGTATVGVVYALTRRIADMPTAVTAAVFLAVSPLHVRDSHFAMTDILATFFTVWALFLLVRAADDRAAGWFGAAGFVAGLAASTKYTMAALAASMAVAQIAMLGGSATAWRQWRNWQPSMAFAAACACGFLVGTPYALIDAGRFLDGVAYDFTHLSGGHNGAQVGIGWSYHVLRSLPAALGWPLFIAGLAGFVPMIHRQPRAAAIVGAFGAAVYLSLAPGHTVFFRYILPLTPLLCISAAFASRAVTPAPRLTALALAVPALVTSIWSDVLLARTDTRVIASRWLADHVKAGESLYQAGSDFADVPLETLRPQAWPRGVYDAGSGRFGATTLPDWLIVPESALALYTSVPSSLRDLATAKYDLVHRVRATRPGVVDAGVYDLDDAFFLPVTGFGAILRPGPTIVIYHRANER